jgi:large subunit ribosomal protein L25
MARMVIEAEPRAGGGKNVARRLRAAGKVPGVLYGANKETVAVSLNPKQLAAVLHSQSGHNTILSVNLNGGETSSAMIVDWQYEPLHGALLHVDLKRIALDQVLRVVVPVIAVGEAPGVKTQGGILEYVLREVQVECLPADIPERIEANISELVIGAPLRVKDLKAPECVKITADPEQPVVHVVALKVVEEKPAAEAAPAEGAAEAAPAEPEVIKKGKAEQEEAEGSAEAKKKEPAEAKKK